MLYFSACRLRSVVIVLFFSACEISSGFILLYFLRLKRALVFCVKFISSCNILTLTLF